MCKNCKQWRVFESCQCARTVNDGGDIESCQCVRTVSNGGTTERCWSVRTVDC